MPKNIETIDLTNPDHEEEEVVYKNDKSHRFTPIEQIAIEETQLEEKFDKDSEPHQPSDYSEEEAEKKSNELKAEILKFRESEGVSSVYTDGEEVEQKQETKNILEKEFLPRLSRRKNDDPITSMSAEQVTRKDKTYLTMRKPFRTSSGENSGAEHDNLKTVKKNIGKDKDGFQKMIKGMRGFFSKLFSAQQDRNSKEESHEDEMNEEMTELYQKYKEMIKEKERFIDESDSIDLKTEHESSNNAPRASKTKF